MQTRGTFPALNSGMKKSGMKKMPKAGMPKSKMPMKKHMMKSGEMMGMGSFMVKGKGPRQNHAPKTFAGRRTASHDKAYGK